MWVCRRFFIITPLYTDNIMCMAVHTSSVAVHIKQRFAFINTEIFAFMHSYEHFMRFAPVYVKFFLGALFIYMHMLFDYGTGNAMISSKVLSLKPRPTIV